MMKKYTAIPIFALWAILTAWTWLRPADAFSDAERRPLAQAPEVSAESIFSGKFMTEFEDFSLDQFPLREDFRSLKSLFQTKILGQLDNNGIYIAEGYAAKMEYPLKESSLEHALERFGYLKDKYLSGSDIYFAAVPDKGYYLAEESGRLAMDYDTFFSALKDGMPWATHIDLTGTLSIEDYYRTDTHWRQENLLPAAQAISQAMALTAPQAEDFTAVTLERPFYGVYYGQAALPMEPDALTYLESDLLKNCTVYDFESGSTIQGVYDAGKLEGKDLYEFFLSGPRSLLTIENPNAATDRELLIFRDSFGSSIAPLLVRDYAKVTLVDIRYIQIDVLDRFVEFNGQDVLFLYSTLVLNNSTTIK